MRNKKKNRKSRIVDNRLYITSANELDKSTIEKINQLFANDAEPVVTVDPSLIGGIRIKKGTQLFDGTISKSLQDLKKNLYQL